MKGEGDARWIGVAFSVLMPRVYGTPVRSRVSSAFCLLPSPFRLYDGENLIGRDISQGLEETTGPPDLDEIHALVMSQTEVDAQIVGRQVAVSAPYLIDLNKISRDHLHSCADTVRVAPGSDGLYADPVVPVRGFVAHQGGRRFLVRHEDVDVSIVVVIPEDRGATHLLLVEECSGSEGDIGERTLTVVSVELVLLCEGHIVPEEVHVVEYVPVRGEDVLVTVVVAVEEGRAEGEQEDAGFCEAGDVGDVGEGTVRIVAEQLVDLEGEVAYKVIMTNDK